MTTSSIAGERELAAQRAVAAAPEPNVSAVSWAAIIAGAVAASALALVLYALGVGLGLSAAGASNDAAATAKAIGVGVVIWMIVVQWFSAGTGGYLAGRLRTKWSGIHADEVFFRDTAHGFLAWAVGAILSAVLLSSAVSSIAGAGASAVSSLGSSVTQIAGQAAGKAADKAPDLTAPFIDSLLRPQKPTADGSAEGVRSEVGRILVASVQNGQLAPEDKTYLVQLVATRTGLNPQDAEKRLNDTLEKAKAAAASAAQKAKDVAEAARKTTSYLAFATCLSMIIGALIASVAGALGGRARDV